MSPPNHHPQDTPSSDPASQSGEAREEITPEADLVERFSAALLAKLQTSEKKYGWDHAWLREDWQPDLARHLAEHVEKGDPIDVAAYAAFAWHHGWSVARPPAPASPSTEGLREDDDPCPHGEHCCCCGPGDTCCDCGATLIDLNKQVAADRWRDFLDDNPDDLTSPEDLPNHALVTFEQFFEMARDILPRIPALSTPVAETAPGDAA